MASPIKIRWVYGIYPRKLPLTSNWIQIGYKLDIPNKMVSESRLFDYIYNSQYSLIVYYMQFLKWTIVILFFSLILFSCDLNKNENYLLVKYRGYNVNDWFFEDSLLIKYTLDEKSIKLDVDYGDTTKIVKLKFDADGIYCSPMKGEFEMVVEYISLSVIESPCYTVYPIIGERHGWLGSKYFRIDHDSFLVHKYYIDREENPFISSVAVYFLDDFGFLIFHFEGGNYLIPDEVIGNTSIPWKRVIAEVKQDTSFSELQPTPPPPPVPNLSKE